MMLLNKYKNIINQHRWQLCLFLVLVFQFVLINSAVSDDSKLESKACADITNRFDRRVCYEAGIRDRPFVIIPHKPNYIIGSWVDELELQNEIYDDYETKFQISFKVPLFKHDLDTTLVWYFGYTQLSVWQMLNFEHSAPFRDTNFEPELMLYWIPKSKISMSDWRLRLINFGIVDHQSNGQVPPISRSWNRSYIEAAFEKGRNYINFRVWKRWNESKKENPDDYKGDDNPQIEEYVGHGEVRFLHLGNRNNLSLAVRDTTHRDGRGSVQFDWTFSMFDEKGMRFYVQYFKGYGETLIDYNIKRKRIGFGVMLADWL